MTDITEQKTPNLKLMLENENEKRALINSYIEGNLKPDVDFGSIVIKGNTSKPTLFKPGSEKMCNLFKLTPRFTRDNDTWEMLGKRSGVLCYKCELVDTTGTVVGEGRGTASTAMQSDFDINKQVKIAEKRAQIDAVLRVFALSERFTQDIEDMPQEEPKLYQNPIKTPSVQSSNDEKPLSYAQITAIERFKTLNPDQWAVIARKYNVINVSSIKGQRAKEFADEVFKTWNGITPKDRVYPTPYNRAESEFNRELLQEENR